MTGERRVVRGAKALGEPLASSVVTLGTFDGVHLGHQELMRRTVAAARARGAPAVAYTFDPHPAKLLAPHMAPRTLTSIEERAAIMFGLGIDLVVVEPFDRAFADLTADAWVGDWLVRMLRPVHVVVGFNFSYGRDRGGDPRHLEASGARLGFSVEIVEPVIAAGSVCSSTRIRELLLEGQVEGAHQLLSRPFALTGRVVRGDERGRTIGFPTANLELEHEIVPANGVYATRVFSEPGATPVLSGQPAVTNIGLRPTFGGSSLSIETHILDFSGDLYGQRLRVEVIHRVREERRFTGVEALVAQIREDITVARRVLGG